MIRACRDCHQENNEDPDDPAPGLCPECYDRRMGKVHAAFVQVVDVVEGDPIAATAWLAKALHEVGGETPAFATKHANDLLIEVLGLDIE